MKKEIDNKIQNIKLLLLDVDGVLTDGSITYTDSGEEIKSFNAKDGLGIRLLMDSGVGVGIITGRKSNALVLRCKNLGIELLFDGISDKLQALDAVMETTGISLDAIAFAGDDLPDIPVMKKVGLSFAVADASPDVIKAADITCAQSGGKGAVRHICERILKSKGLWPDILIGFNG